MTGVNRSADEAIARNPAQSFRPQNLKIGRVPNARSSTPPGRNDAIRPKQRPSPHRGITGRVLRAGFAGATGARRQVVDGELDAIVVVSRGFGGLLTKLFRGLPCARQAPRTLRPVTQSRYGNISKIYFPRTIDGAADDLRILRISSSGSLITGVGRSRIEFQRREPHKGG